MKKYTVGGTVHMEATGATLDEAIKAWQEKAGGGMPDSWEDGVGDGEIIGACEGCGRAILDEAPHHHDSEGGYFCTECVE